MAGEHPLTSAPLIITGWTLPQNLLFPWQPAASWLAHPLRTPNTRKRRCTVVSRAHSSPSIIVGEGVESLRGEREPWIQPPVQPHQALLAPGLAAWGWGREGGEQGTLEELLASHHFQAPTCGQSATE